MALYVQHGHGKSDKIAAALDDGTVEGVIFGARNEKPDSLRAYVDELRGGHSGCELFLDPQFYVSTLTPPNDRYLPEYPYYTAGRTASDLTGLRRIRQYARETLDCQVDLGLDGLLSPTVLFDSFSDRWHQIALSLADASLEHHAGLSDPPPLLLSFAFEEKSLGVNDEVNRFLDTVTQDDWNMEGFYLVVARDEKTYNQRFDETHLAQYLYLVHALGQVNGLRVICGYTDFVGIALRAAGADGFACGWNHSLRQFHPGNFKRRRPGGQPARERYSSGPLFNSILITELQEIYEVGCLANCLSSVPLDRQVTSAADPLSAGWTTALSQGHHWQVLSALDRRLSGRLRPDLQDVDRQLRDANGLYTALEGAGVTFSQNTGRSHLRDWFRAIAEFRRTGGFSS